MVVENAPAVTTAQLPRVLPLASGMVAPAVMVPATVGPVAQEHGGHLPADSAIRSMDAVLAVSSIPGLDVDGAGVVSVGAGTPISAPASPSPCPHQQIRVVESDDEEEDMQHSFLGFHAGAPADTAVASLASRLDAAILESEVFVVPLPVSAQEVPPLMSGLAVVGQAPAKL